jgi:hypothetical protein
MCAGFRSLWLPNLGPVHWLPWAALLFGAYSLYESFGYHFHRDKP